MSERLNKRIVSIKSIITVLIVFFGMLLCCSYFKGTAEVKKKPAVTYIRETSDVVISDSPTRLQVFQKTWILNKDNFNPMAFNRNPLSVDRKIMLKISQLLTIRQNLFRIPRSSILVQLYPCEKDHPQILS